MGFVKTDIKTIEKNVFRMIGDEWALVTAKKDGQVNTMTVSWGGMGVLWGKEVATIYIRPQRYTKEFIDAGEMFTIRTLVDLSGMAVLYAYHIQTRELQMKFEVDTLQNILEMQYKNYQLSQESIEIVNQKYHDLKHQITLLKAEANSQKSIQYLEEMEQDIRSYEAQNKTGNKVLDAVLTSKSLYCHNNDISLTCVADGTLLDFMAEMDISALFGNVLDNAIESVQKLDDKEKRLIHLSVAEQKSFLRIRVENYTEENISFRNGMPVTTKKDKHLHGFGMKSIQSTVRKYGGSVTTGLRDNWFELRILIPLNQQKTAN